MLITIILLLAITAGILLIRWDREGWDILGFALTIISSLFMLIHCVAFAVRGYDYRETEARRSAIVQTLKEFRQSGDAIERAAVVKDIMKFNADLAVRKYYLGTAFAVYYDKRFEQMEPIK